jgi:hypothetical protein
VATVNEPGQHLPLLIDGLEYPGVQVAGVGFDQNTGFDIGNFDITPYDNIDFGPEGRPTYDPAILDAIYESSYLDPFLGTRPTDINVDGGAYVDTYSSFAPEELVPGAEFDTLDMRVYTRPGSDWETDGHGFPTSGRAILVESVPAVVSFESWYDSVPYLVSGTLTNRETNVGLLPGVNYTVDWAAKTFTVTSGISVGDSLQGLAYGLGGGNQLFRSIYAGDTIGNSVIIPVAYSELQEVVVWVNGQPYVDLTYAAGTGNTTVVTFDSTFTDSDLVTLYAFGPTIINGDPVNYSWSAPVTQYIVADGTTTLFALNNSLAYSNPANLVVGVNGRRLRTPAGIEHYADGSTAYSLPGRLGFSQSLIADNDVMVYINDIPQTLGVDFTVDPYVGQTRQVVFANPPAEGQRILISVKTNAQAVISGGQSLFIDPTRGVVPVAGDIITVATWNDTRQQDIITTVYVGPVESGAIVTQGYDQTDFDAADISFEPGSFDYTEGVIVTNNDLWLARPNTDPARLGVTLNGGRLFVGEDFVIVNGEIVLADSIGTLNPNDVVIITEFTNSVVPEAMAFRVFQDMRGAQAIYRITADSTTTLTQPLELQDDIIYVENAENLAATDISANIWGVLTIDGERIMYRNRDTVNNTVSSLRRGTAGTAIAEHRSGAYVYAMARGEIMPAEFQNYVSSNTFVGDNSTTSYTTDIVIDNRPIVSVGGSVDVYINSILQNPNSYRVTALEPVVVVFDSIIPVSGSIIRIDVTSTLGVTTTQSITATGSSARFPTTLDIGLVEQSSSTYVLDDFEPVIITFDTPVPEGRVVYIANQRGGEDEFDYSFSDGVDPTFATDINLTLPIRVYVGGIEQTNVEDYIISSLDPVVVNFVTAPESGTEITVFVSRGVTWYAPGAGTPSNGVALQDTNTQAARFLRGL